MSIETDIIDKIISILDTDVPEINTINYERVYMSTGDIQEHEIPCVQIWDVTQSIEHERGRARVTWSLSLEIILKSLYTAEANQKELLELRRKIQLALWDKPNLGIPGVIHLVYNGNVTDLHLMEPFYIARMDFDVLFYDDLTGSC